MTTSFANAPDFEPAAPSADGPTAATPSPVPSDAGEPTVATETLLAWAPGGEDVPVPVFPLAGEAGGQPSWDRGTAGYPTPGAGPVFGQATAYGAPYPTAGWAPTDGFTGPKAWPVVIFTLFFGVFGAISAARRSRDARAFGLPVARYWQAFGGALVGGFFIWMLSLGILAATLIPLFENYHDSVMVITTDRLESQLMSSSASGVTVTQADCADDSVAPDGTGTYRCQVTFADGVARSYEVTVNDDGSWAASDPN
jgi:hypothetical protein